MPHIRANLFMAGGVNHFMKYVADHVVCFIRLYNANNHLILFRILQKPFLNLRTNTLFLSLILVDLIQIVIGVAGSIPIVLNHYSGGGLRLAMPLCGSKPRSPRQPC